MQLVLSNNRIIAYGENFLVKDNTVVNMESGIEYENATVAECDSYPSDIDVVGYEYHAGVFVPCAPFGTGDNNGYFMEVCTTCATPRNSGLPIKDIKWSTISSMVCTVANTENDINTDFTFPVSAEVLREYSMLRYRIKGDSYIQLGYHEIQVSGSATVSYDLLSLGDIKLLYLLYNNGTGETTVSGRRLTYNEDIVIPMYLTQSRYCRTNASSEISYIGGWYNTVGTQLNPLTITLTIDTGSSYYSSLGNEANVVIELEGRK